MTSWFVAPVPDCAGFDSVSYAWLETVVIFSIASRTGLQSLCARAAGENEERGGTQQGSYEGRPTKICTSCNFSFIRSHIPLLRYLESGRMIAQGSQGLWRLEARDKRQAAGVICFAQRPQASTGFHRRFVK